MVHKLFPSTFFFASANFFEFLFVNSHNFASFFFIFEIVDRSQLNCVAMSAEHRKGKDVTAVMHVGDADLNAAKGEAYDNDMQNRRS